MGLIIGLFQSGSGNIGALSSADVQWAAQTLARRPRQDWSSRRQTQVELKASVSQSMQIAWHIGAAQPLPGTDRVGLVLFCCFFVSCAANPVQQPCW